LIRAREKNRHSPHSDKPRWNRKDSPREEKKERVSKKAGLLGMGTDRSTIAGLQVVREVKTTEAEMVERGVSQGGGNRKPSRTNNLVTAKKKRIGKKTVRPQGGERLFGKRKEGWEESGAKTSQGKHLQKKDPINQVNTDYEAKKLMAGQRDCKSRAPKKWLLQKTDTTKTQSEVTVKSFWFQRKGATQKKGGGLNNKTGLTRGKKNVKEIRMNGSVRTRKMWGDGGQGEKRGGRGRRTWGGDQKTTKSRIWKTKPALKRKKKRVQRAKNVKKNENP